MHVDFLFGFSSGWRIASFFVVVLRTLTCQPCILPGAGPAGVTDVKNHPFFATINWEWLTRRLVVPPFKPVVSHIDDAFHFDTEFTSRTPRGTGIIHVSFYKHVVVDQWYSGSVLASLSLFSTTAVRIWHGLLHYVTCAPSLFSFCS